MMHEKFHYDSLDSLRKRAEELGAFLPLSDNLDILKTPLVIRDRVLPNRLATQPMEGTDGTQDGAPGEKTRRRYLRFAKGGSSLIWFEAVATVPEGRASAHQLMLTEKTLPEFQHLVDEIRETGLRENGFAPIIIMQATNSGRYSKPHGYPEPMIAYNNPCLEDTPLDSSHILSDDTLARYEERFGPVAALAQKAGFDGMDVKCCHRYLACELLSAYTREGKYGTSYENRTRFIKNAFRAAKAAVSKDFWLTTRMNVYDGFPYPWGFGMQQEGGLKYDLSEPIRLVGELKQEMNLPLIDITIGNPYKNPHVNRPYDHGNYVPDEHPLEGESRMMSCVSQVQKAYPDLPVLGSAFSYVRQYSANLAAGMIEGGHAQLAGFGRMAFANPDFANQIVHNNGIDASRVCLTCGRCAQLLREGIPSGCAVRDELYR